MTDNPSSTQTTPEHIIRDELEKAASLITAAHSLMNEGRSIDLSALEERVRIITEAITAAPPEIATTFKESLGSLLKVLNALQADLEDQHKALEDNLTAMKRRSATDAYGPSTPQPAPPPESDEN